MDAKIILQKNFDFIYRISLYSFKIWKRFQLCLFFSVFYSRWQNVWRQSCFLSLSLSFFVFSLFQFICRTNGKAATFRVECTIWNWNVKKFTNNWKICSLAAQHRTTTIERNKQNLTVQRVVWICWNWRYNEFFLTK